MVITILKESDFRISRTAAVHYSAYTTHKFREGFAEPSLGADKIMMTA